MATPPVDALLAEGETHAHAGRFPQAEACAASVLARQPRNARAHYLLGLSALFQQRAPQALEHLERAVKNDRVNAQYHFALGMALASAGRRDEAVASYRRALQFRPRFFEALANLGNVLESAGRFEEAAAAYRAALALRAEEPLVLNGLGYCEISLKRPAQAVAPLEHALRLRPDFTTAMNNLANARAALHENAQATALLRRAVELRPDFTEAWINLAEQLYMARDDAGAIAAFDRALALDPSNAGARYLRDAIAGKPVDRAPDDFVRRFFDRFAADFDRRLTGELGYRAPEELADFLKPWLEGREALSVVDLGCGTGLSGVFVRPRAVRLVGVDLSSEMLARARQRGVYDELAEAEIAGFLAAQPAASFDLAIAADVFVYVGELEPVFRACAAALAPGGCFAFSVEHLEEGAGFRLARTGRYAHSQAYVERVAATTGFHLARSHPFVVRHDEGQPVHGRLYALTT